MKQLLLACALLLCAPATAYAQEQAAPPALSAEATAEIEAGEANRARIATAPRMQDSPEWTYPEAERAQGHHGRVVVRGLLGVDGRLRHATVSESSRAPVLDQAALDWAVASTFTPALDAEGAPIAVMISVPTEFYSFTSREGVGAAMYTCRQFVLDMDWWRATFADKPMSDHHFYTLIRGLGVMMNMSQGAQRALQAAGSNEEFLRRWNEAIEGCRRRPEARFAEVMRPEGDAIDRMAREHERRRR